MTTPQQDIPRCPGPPASQRASTRITIPRGAVDTHAHVIGSPPDYPYIPKPSYIAPDATAESYVAMLNATGMTYGVLTQISVHGTDNRLLTQTLIANPKRLRGIGVIALDCPDKERAALKAAGVVGLRINAWHGGGIGLEQIGSYAAICKEMGWHLQILLDARTLPAMAPTLAKLPVPLLIDHMGHFPNSAGVAHEGFKTLLALLRDGAWVRLSGAYRNCDQGPPYASTVPFAHKLIEAAPDRCVWGSDWPHVANWGAMMGVCDLLDLLADWAPDEKLRNRILVDNPQRLFGFPVV